MVFSSNIFLFMFLPAVLGIYYISKNELRNIIFLLASLFFYAWAEPSYIWIIILSIVINYLAGLLMGRTDKISVKRLILAAGILLNILLLFYFKYYDFVVSSINRVFDSNLSLKNIALPVGISFYTFSGLSYIIDVYMGKAEAQKNPMNIALYISMFPKLVQGPIVKFKDVENQLHDRRVTAEGFAEGIRRFVFGLSKKVLLANQLGSVAGEIFGDNPLANSVSTAWLGAILYTLQLYFDFSGYSDMAIGLGKMFGFDFMENFNYPYISKSISEFWRRWHISLGAWFREYVYIPLGGNRRGNVYVNLFIVFLLTGIWHGASWNFIIWGIWHGIFMLIERFVKKHKKTREESKNVFLSFFKWAYTSLAVIVGWVMFNSPGMSYAWDYIKVMFGMEKPQPEFSIMWYLDFKLIILIIVAVIACLPVKNQVLKLKIFKNETVRIVAGNIYTALLLIVSLMFMMTDTYNAFIYFKF